MAIDISLITKLRESSGAGVGDCREALMETNGDLDKALDVLRKKGAKTAAKRADRVLKEGVIATYIHSNKKLATLVALGCETDFVAKNADFQQLAADLAMHVAASSPEYASPDKIDPAVVEEKRASFMEELAKENKPAEIMEKIIEGKMQKWYQEVCLTKQPFIKNEDITIEDLINEKVASIGEKIEVVDFYRSQIYGGTPAC